MKAVAIILSVAAAAWASPQGGYNYQAPEVQPQPQYAAAAPAPQYDSAPAQYNFQWDVNDQYSGNFYGHQEQRDGSNTQGNYYVRLPDTRLMRVEYYVDEYGFHPTVTYEGEAQYPSAPAQNYAQPAPAPSQVYVQPAPAPQQTYQQPAPAPSQQYLQPGK